MQNMKRLLSLEWIAIFVLILAHTIAAYTSFGYHHPDEHFQILEWANYFLGLNPDASKLPWEFTSQIRPWFQPFLHVLFMKPLLALGIYEPFNTAFLFRLIYGLLNVAAMLELWKYFKREYKLNPAWFLWISLLWFFPYIHVRTSSENLAGIFLCFGMLKLLDKKQYLWSGILFGFAFLARYQIALGLAGLGVALLIRDRKVIKNHLLLLLGFLIPVGLGVVIDRVGYGNWVFTPYRYFKVNIVDGVAAQYAPHPWWMYFNWLFQLNPLISLPLFFGAAKFMKKGSDQDRFLLGSFVWAFFILHCFITNKEYRFLFPILNFIPFMAMISFQSFDVRLKKAGVLIPYIALNLLCFGISTLRGASLNTSGALTLASRNLDSTRMVFASHDYRNQISFYSFKPHELKVFLDSNSLLQDLQEVPNAQVLVNGRFDEEKTQSVLKVIADKECKLNDSAIPLRLYEIGTKLKLIKSIPFVAWYDCKKST